MSRAGRRARAPLAIGLLACGLAPAQSITVPVRTVLVVRSKAPLDTTRIGARFAAVLVEDVVVEYLGVAAAGDPCAGIVTSDAGVRTLRITELQTPFARHRIAAGEPIYGADPAPPANVVGFAGPLAAPSGPDTSARVGQPVVFDASHAVLPAGTTLECTLSEPWVVSLHQTESVFPQPEDAQPSAAQASVPAGWFAHVEQQSQQQRAEASERARAAATADRRHVYRNRVAWRGNARWGTTVPMSTPQPMRSLTRAQHDAMRPQPATLPEGTDVVARINEPIDSSKFRPDTPFAAVLMIDLVADQRIVFPRGSGARGVITIGQLDERVVPTLALTQLQLGGLRFQIRTGASQVLHWPAPPPSVGGMGLATMADEGSLWAKDGTLRLPEGTIVVFDLAAPVTVR